MGQAPKFLHRTQLAKLKKKNHSKSSTHNPTLPSSQQSITNITQHYKVITAKFYTEPKITAKSQYQVLHIDPLKPP